MKKTFKRMISSKPIKYQAPADPMQSRLPAGTKPKLTWPGRPAGRNTIHQYGDKKYRPSNGRGVGY